MNTSLMRCKKVASTAPTIGPICAAAMPSRSHASVVSKMRAASLSIAARRVLGEHPACCSRWRQAKRAHRFRSHAALQPKIREDGNDEADEPPATLFGFPKPRLGMLIAVGHRLP